LKAYFNIDIKEKILNGYKGNLSQVQIGFIEILIAQDKIIDIFTKEEKNLLLSQAILNLEKRKEIGESLYRQLTTAFLISRILNSQNLNPSEKDESGNDIFSVFNSTGEIVDITIIDKLLVASKKVN